MTRMRLNSRHVMNGLALLGLLAVAGIVQATAPGSELQYSAMPVAGAPAAVGEPLRGRNLTATITEVRIVQTPESEALGTLWRGETPGSWVLVELEAACIQSSCALSSATLQIGDSLFSASTRASTHTMQSYMLAVGIPRAGNLLFEVPSASVKGESTGTMRLAVQRDTRLDSELAFSLDLGGAEHVESATFEAPHWSNAP